MGMSIWIPMQLYASLCTRDKRMFEVIIVWNHPPMVVLRPVPNFWQVAGSFDVVQRESAQSRFRPHGMSAPAVMWPASCAA